MAAGVATALRFRKTGLLAVWGLAIGLAACTLPPFPAAPPPVVAAGESPAAAYRRLADAGRPVWRVDPAASLIVAEVGRAGPLARLGHDHVVAAHAVTGYVAPEDGRADLEIALADLAVDEPELRAAAGFESQPGAEAIAGTRRNMLDKVFDAERFPRVGVRIDRPAAGDGFRVHITLRGTTREFSVPVVLEPISGGLRATGRLSLLQSDFGIVPFAVLGGALQVRDRVDLRFDIRTQPP